MKISLSPSSASSWLYCTQGPVFCAENGLKSKPSKFSEEGKEDHDLAAKMLIAHYENTGVKYCGTDPKRFHTVKKYVEEVTKLVEPRKNSSVFIENKIDNVHNESYSIIDFLAANNDKFIIRDLKTGWTRVDSRNNEQLIIYSINVIEFFRPILEVEKMKVDTGIIQPPRQYHRGVIYEYDQLMEEKEKIVTVAKKIMNREGLKFEPSAKNCKWCPAKGKCPATTVEAMLPNIPKVKKPLDLI